MLDYHHRFAHQVAPGGELVDSGVEHVQLDVSGEQRLEIDAKQQHIQIDGQQYQIQEQVRPLPGTRRRARDWALRLLRIAVCTFKMMSVKSPRSLDISTSRSGMCPCRLRGGRSSWKTEATSSCNQARRSSTSRCVTLSKYCLIVNATERGGARNSSEPRQRKRVGVVVCVS